MKQGIVVSGIGHVAILALVAFGLPWVQPEPPAQMQVTEVTVMSEQEFSAAISQAPELPDLDFSNLEAPTSEANDAERPDDAIQVTKTEIDITEDPSEADGEADLTAFDDLMVQPTARVESGPITMPTMEVESSMMSLGADSSPSLSLGGFGGAPSMTSMEAPTPRSALRIDTTPDIAPPPDVRRAEKVVEAVEAAPAETPEDAPVEVVEEVEATAPEESVTSIEPEAKPDAAPSAAPTTAALPPRRSANFKAPRPEPEPAPEPEPEPEGPSAADLLSAAIESAVEESAAEPEPVALPLSASDIMGMNLAISNCWKVPAGVRELERLVVVLGLNLSLDGYVVGNIQLIEPSGVLDGPYQAVYDAAAQAIIECQPYVLPPDSYEQWRDLELVFDPSYMELNR